MSEAISAKDGPPRGLGREEIIDAVIAFKDWPPTRPGTRVSQAVGG
jgi:hypothetical protein